jgi:hypothetical protein
MEYLGQIKLKDTNAYSLDLQAEIIRAHPIAVKQTKDIAYKFKGATPLQTCFNIWKYLRENINYVKDEPNTQRIFLPSAFLHFKKGDCKSYSTFAAAILCNIYKGTGIQTGFVFTSYKSREIPSHIYVCIKLRNDTKIYLDGCYYEFNVEKTPTYKKIVYLHK